MTETIRRRTVAAMVLCAALLALHGPWDDPGGPPAGCGGRSATGATWT